MSPFRLRHYLRRETRIVHERVDRALSCFALDDEAQLELFLAAQAGALRPLEAALEDGGIGALVADWPARRRAHLLADLGSGVPKLPVAPFRTDAEMLGAAYVLEGSRLGARILLGRLSGLDSRMARLGAAFLSHDPGGPHWQVFVATLDRLGAEATRSKSLRGALNAFRLFERSANAVRGAPEIQPERIAASSRRSSGMPYDSLNGEERRLDQHQADLDHPEPGAL